MSSIKEFNVKLKSLGNTQKITKTMKMVSASKLRKAQEAQANAKEYAKSIQFLISRITTTVDSSIHPLLNKKDEIKSALILVVTSDKGLCGAFNNNANKRVEEWIQENSQNYERIDLSFCGRRGFNYFQKRQQVKNYYENMTANPTFEMANKIGHDISTSFIENEYDEVYITYNEFFSPLSQKTTFDKILPIDPELLKQVDEEEVQLPDYIFEPVVSEMLNFLVPHFLYFKIYFALLENSAGEHGARMTAMDNATKNASELIDKYTLLRNRARQAAITTELTEIVAGAESI